MSACSVDIYLECLYLECVYVLSAYMYASSSPLTKLILIPKGTLSVQCVTDVSNVVSLMLCF
jgi:hypothetical protein